VIHVVVGQDERPQPREVESLADDVAGDPVEGVTVGHSAVDQRVLAAAVDQVDVTVRVVGKAEREVCPAANDVDLGSETHAGPPDGPRPRGAHLPIRRVDSPAARL
jgi:hypothetical protein